jgi:hypothetical protein
MSSIWADPIAPSYMSDRLERKGQNAGDVGSHLLCARSPNER